MNELEKLERRWRELVGRPRSKQEIEESLVLAKRIELERAKEISGLISELKEKGIYINSIWDLVNTKVPYPEAIDILINHLSENYSDKNKEGIIRSLIVKEAKEKAISTLISEYNNIPNEKKELLWITGYAIVKLMKVNDAERVILMIVNRLGAANSEQLIEKLQTLTFKELKKRMIEVLNGNQVYSRSIVSG